MGIDLSLSERVREREMRGEREGTRRRERSSHSPETTNTNRSLNRKHNLKETEAARIEPWPRVTAMSAPGFVPFPPTNDKIKMLVLTRHDVAAQQGGRRRRRGR